MKTLRIAPYQQSSICFLNQAVKLLSLVLAGALAGNLSAATPIFDFGFDEGSGTTSTSTGSSAATGSMLDGSEAAADLFGSPGSGITGGANDYALDLSFAGSVGGDGPVFQLPHAQTTAVEGLASFTIAGWYNMPTLGSAFLIDYSTGNNGFYAYMNGDGTISLNVNGYDPRSSSAAFSDTNQWVFFAIAYDGTSTTNNLNFYIGDSSTTGVTSAGTSTLNKGTVVDTSVATMYIGKKATWNNNGSIDGLLDDFQIYGSLSDGTGALNLAEIASIHDAAVVPEISASTSWIAVIAGLAMIMVRVKKRRKAAIQ